MFQCVLRTGRPGRSASSPAVATARASAPATALPPSSRASPAWASPQRSAQEKHRALKGKAIASAVIWGLSKQRPRQVSACTVLGGCSVNCTWEDWNEWTACSATCGEGGRVRPGQGRLCAGTLANGPVCQVPLRGRRGKGPPRNPLRGSAAGGTGPRFSSDLVASACRTGRRVLPDRQRVPSGLRLQRLEGDVPSTTVSGLGICQPVSGPCLRARTGDPAR